MTYDPDDITGGFLDSRRFTDYAAAVRKVIEKANHPLSIADMRRAMGENFMQRFHADVLEYLMSDSAIREVPSGAMTRYEPSVRHERNEKKMKFSITKSSCQTFATALLD